MKHDVKLDRRGWLIGSSSLLCLPTVSSGSVDVAQPRTAQGIDWYDHSSGVWKAEAGSRRPVITIGFRVAQRIRCAARSGI